MCTHREALWYLTATLILLSKTKFPSIRIFSQFDKKICGYRNLKIYIFYLSLSTRSLHTRFIHCAISFIPLTLSCLLRIVSYNDGDGDSFTQTELNYIWVVFSTSTQPHRKYDIPLFANINASIRLRGQMLAWWDNTDGFKTNVWNLAEKHCRVPAL